VAATRVVATFVADPAAAPAAVPTPATAEVPTAPLASAPKVPAEAPLVPSQASPAPAGRPANDSPTSLLVPVAPPPTIAPPGPAHWLTAGLPDGFAPIPLPPGQNSIRYYLSAYTTSGEVTEAYFGAFAFVVHLCPEIVSQMDGTGSTGHLLGWIDESVVTRCLHLIIESYVSVSSLTWW
jgi:hypothetical protein